MAGIVDFHTHAFPDQIAASAIASLEHEGGIKADEFSDASAC